MSSLATRRRRQPLDAYSLERYQPYRAMWAKVIMRAAYDFALWRDSKDIRLKNYARDAERWLFDENLLMNGFRSICDILNVDGEKIRLYARNLTRDQVKKLEFMEREGRDPLRLVMGLEEVDEVPDTLVDEAEPCESYGSGR